MRARKTLPAAVVISIVGAFALEARAADDIRGPGGQVVTAEAYPLEVADQPLVLPRGLFEFGISLHHVGSFGAFPFLPESFATAGLGDGLALRVGTAFSRGWLGSAALSYLASPGLAPNLQLLATYEGRSHAGRGGVGFAGGAGLATKWRLPGRLPLSVQAFDELLWVYVPPDFPTMASVVLPVTVACDPLSWLGFMLGARYEQSIASLQDLQLNLYQSQLVASASAYLKFRVLTAGVGAARYAGNVNDSEFYLFASGRLAPE